MNEKIMLKSLFEKLKGSTAPKWDALCMELTTDSKCCPLPKMTHPIWKGHAIQGPISIHISLQPLLFKTQIRLKKKKKVWRIILRESGGKVVRKWHSSTHIFSVLLFDQPII